MRPHNELLLIEPPFQPRAEVMPPIAVQIIHHHFDNNDVVLFLGIAIAPKALRGCRR